MSDLCQRANGHTYGRMKNLKKKKNDFFLKIEKSNNNENRKDNKAFDVAIWIMVAMQKKERMKKKRKENKEVGKWFNKSK